MATRRCLLLAALSLGIAALPIHAGTEIQSIDFDTLPDGLRLVGAQITLGGDTIVQGNLQLSGVLALGPGAAITFDPPRQGSLLLGPGDFVPRTLTDSSSNWFAGVHYRFAEPGDSFLQGVAAIKLPVGAEVTALVCWFYDNDADIDLNGTADLYGQASPEFEETLHWLAAAPNAPRQSLQLIEVVGTELAPLVAQPATTYYLIFGLATDDFVTNVFNFRFYGCRIDYEISTWSP
jgi:hypothetical protein